MLPEDRVLFMGEQICAVLAETRAAALEGARRVRVDYEELPAVFDVEEAIKAPSFKKDGPNYFVYEGHHCRRIRFGDVEKGFAAADHVIEQRYESSPIEHAPVETTGCTAKPEGNGRITVYSDTQALYFTLDNMALILDVPFNRLRLVGGTVGGGFGGKVDVIVEPIAALGAMLTNRPVKYVYSRPEEMQVSLAAGVGAHLHQGRGDERRADRRPARSRSTSTPAPTAGTRPTAPPRRRRTCRGPTRSRTSTSTPGASTPTARRPRRCAASG